jgi:large subunit ribosomal protein L7/L12
MNTEQQPTISHIEKLKRQKQIIEARIQKAEARQKTQERKAETRRKILLGAYFLDKLRKDGALESIKSDLDSFLRRNRDRALFGLPALENETS